MKQKPRWTLEMLTAALAVLCALLVLVLLVQRPAIWPVLVVLAGFFFEISKIEWCICLLLCGLIMALELVNTSVEAVVDLVTEKRKPLAKIAKDTAAGAVLIAALFSAVIGCIIFVPKIMEWFTFF